MRNRMTIGGHMAKVFLKDHDSSVLRLFIIYFFFFGIHLIGYYHAVAWIERYIYEDVIHVVYIGVVVKRSNLVYCFAYSLYS